MVTDEEVRDGIDGEAGVKTEVQTDVIVQGHLGQEEIIQSGLVCEADDKKEMRVFATVDNEKKNAEEQKVNMEAVIERAKLEAVDEYKRNTPYCHCERALAAEKLDWRM
ncbi:hypothetical protein QVD17_19729 [Tagetes erecta]|uniref:Uncharacterized protein n=1 Tax=Tagetes erecta TaxID=13708 RepID=A0AAD8KJZ3_TARER|nr:hypothetical protein QVD17_19729 [Tagetes erecta]